MPGINDYHSVLYRCASCGIVFRDRLLSTEQLQILYGAMPETEWTYEAPVHWVPAQEAIRKHSPSRRVLDIGCFRGDFLASLGPEYALYGVEPNSKAARIAADRQVTILGEYIETLDQVGERFGAIVMMDVIEHVQNPQETLARCRDLLEPGGLLVLFTGDADSRYARRMLPYYWYMALPYHLYFLGFQFVEWIAAKQNWEVLSYQRIPHKPPPTVAAAAKQRLIYTAESLWKNLLQPRRPLRWLGRLPLLSHAARRHTPYPFFHLTDHMLVVLRKS